MASASDHTPAMVDIVYIGLSPQIVNLRAVGTGSKLRVTEPVADQLVSAGLAVQDDTVGEPQKLVDDMTVAELHDYAKRNAIDIPSDVTTKDAIRGLLKEAL